jgi:hypothetical protein
MAHRAIAIYLLGLSLLISGCGPGQLFGPTVTPTSTPTPTPTPTQTPTPTPTATPTPVAFEMNEFVQGVEEWAITVFSATNAGTSIERTVGLQTYSSEVTKPDTHFIQVVVGLTKLGDESEPPSDLNIEDVILKDDEGNEYPCGLVGGDFFPDARCTQGEPEGQILLTDLVWNVLAQQIEFSFVVPNNAQIVEFVWPDLPPVLLEIE